MCRRSLHRSFLISASLFAACPFILLGCSGAGETRMIDGKLVRKVVLRYALFYGAPIPGRPSEIYWTYTDASGREVKHGPYQTVQEHGLLLYESNYIDGKQDGTATTWNAHGEITNKNFWRAGKLIGWAIYDNGKLNYWNEDVFEHGRRVGSKTFEGGVWNVAFYCGNTIDLQIDSRTGELTHISGGAVACR